LAEKIHKFDELEKIKNKWEKIKEIFEKSEKLKKDILDINRYIIQLENTQKNIKEFKILKNLKTPEIDKPEKSIYELKWLETTTFIFQKSLKIVQKLKETFDLTIPNLQPTESLIQKISVISNLTDRLRNIVLICNNCKNALESLKNLDFIIGKIKNIEEQVTEVSYIINIEKNFLAIARTVKQLKNDYDLIVKEWTAVKIEFEQYKNCPLCNSPLTTAVNNG
jgi:hypothetical protein